MKRLAVGLLALGSISAYASNKLDECKIYINPGYNVDRQIVINGLDEKGFELVNTKEEANFEFKSNKMNTKTIVAGVYARDLSMPKEYNLFNRTISPHAVEGYVFNKKRAYKRAYKYVLSKLVDCDEYLLNRLGF